MRIGFVFDDGLDRPDGVQQYILTLGRYYVSEGHEVHYLVGQTKNMQVNVHPLSRNIAIGFNANKMTIPFGASKKAIRKKLDELQLDVLHVQMPYHPFLSGRIIRAASQSVAVVGTFHVLPFGKLAIAGTRGLALLQRQTHRRFDQVFSVSEVAKEFAKIYYKIDSTVLPNAINIKHFYKARPLKKYDDKLINIAFLGRLVERKGAMQLLKAILKLNKSKELEKVRVMICGKGNLEGKLRQFVLKNNLSRIVEFCGFLEEKDKPNYLASADIACFPALGGESFGIVLIEAMASGSGVVIGGNNPGYRSVLGGKPETLFNPNNTTEFAEKLLSFIKNNNLREDISQYQHDLVKKYDVATVGKKLLKSYEKIIIQKSNLKK